MKISVISIGNKIIDTLNTTVKYSHCSHMLISVHSPWLPGYIDVMQTILVILTMAGLFWTDLVESFEFPLQNKSVSGFRNTHIDYAITLVSFPPFTPLHPAPPPSHIPPL